MITINSRAYLYVQFSFTFDNLQDKMDVFSRRNVNIIFLVIFLTEITFGIIGINKLAMNSYYLIVLVSVIFVSGIYTVS
jgi:hypothetical protein